MRLAWAFFLRDGRIAMSYRISFAMQMLSNLMIIGLFYFIGKVIGSTPLPALQAYGGNFMAYLLIGISLTDCVGTGLFSAATQIREAQMSGTLEATLLSPVPMVLILAFSSLWNFFMSAMRFLCYMIAGAIVYGVDLRRGNVPAAVLIFLMTVLCFTGVGMLWAGVVMIVKRGESIMTFGGMIVLLFSGVLFPPSMLPGWMQHAAEVIPLTPALEGMRHAMLQGYSLQQMLPTLGRLAAFTVFFVLAGIWGFSWSVSLAKRTGSLSQY